LEVSLVSSGKRDPVDQGSGSDQGIGEAQGWQFVPEKPGPIGNAPIHGDLIHAGEEPSHVRFPLTGSSQQLCSGDDRVGESAWWRGQPSGTR
jgi:hypothetical protein